MPMVEQLLEIRGVVIKTVSGFLAEFGDSSRFNNSKGLLNITRLELVENSSGKHKGETSYRSIADILVMRRQDEGSQNLWRQR